MFGKTSSCRQQCQGHIICTSAELSHAECDFCHPAMIKDAFFEENLASAASVVAVIDFNL